jgi:hypothetical protein
MYIIILLLLENINFCLIFCSNYTHSNWQCDPEHPFNPPEHLRDAVDHFEKTEVPRLGLKPIPVVATHTSNEDGLPSTNSSAPVPADVEFVLS